MQDDDILMSRSHFLLITALKRIARLMILVSSKYKEHVSAMPNKVMPILGFINSFFNEFDPFIPHLFVQF